MNETVGVGGAEMLILNLAKELRMRGRSVVCVLPEQDGWLVDQLSCEGIPIETFRIRSRMDLALVERLARVLRARGVRAVHSHEFAMSIHGTAVAHELRCPHVISLHGNQKMLDRLRDRLALRWAVQSSHATVAVSESTRSHVVERLKLGPGKVGVVRNGVPQCGGERASARAALGATDQEVLLLGAGSLVERKGFHVLIDAARILLERGAGSPSWKIVIAGEGSSREALVGQIRASGLDERVRLLGHRSDMDDLQAAADVFVMPSLWEGLPLAVLEAMFAGNAIVATRTSGIPEAIDPGVEGILVEPGEAEPLADALEGLIRSATLRSELGRRAFLRAESEFSMKSMTDRYEELYRENRSVGRPSVLRSRRTPAA